MVDPSALRLAELNEGYRPTPYRDSVGKLTIGIGWNLDDVPMTRPLAQLVCAWMLERAAAQVAAFDPWVETLDAVRHAAIVDLVFNMGVGTWITFRNAREAGKAGEWALMASELKCSQWWHQVGERGPRIAAMLETGKWPWEA